MTTSSTPIDPSAATRLDVNGAPYSPGLSPAFLHDPVEPEPGRFILPKRATTQPGDRFWSTTDCWKQSEISNQTVGSQLSICMIRAYSRAIRDDPTLFAAMQAYAAAYGKDADPIKAAQARLDEAEKAVSAAQRAHTEAEAALAETSRFKVGDWLVAVYDSELTPYPTLVKGNLYRIKGFDPYDDPLIEGQDGPNGWGTRAFTRATPAQIQTHLDRLAAEKAVADRLAKQEETARLAAVEAATKAEQARVAAEAEIIHDGDWVVCLQGTDQAITVGHLYRVKTAKSYMSCGFPGLDLMAVNAGFESNGWLVSRFRRATPSEIFNHQLPTTACPAPAVAPDAPITITVDDDDIYTASFNSGHVTFGCAHISNRQLKDAFHLLVGDKAEKLLDSHSNRRIEAVKIGKGLFTLDLLTRLVAKLRD